ncbi:MAG: hypothetical protein LBS03_08970 [Bacteroidales bacterium]|jgi:hypothetical protein|nr:hypothetical protein [Bacteroidales bacterium]
MKYFEWHTTDKRRGYELKPSAAPLREKSDASAAAWEAYQSAIHRQKEASANEEIARQPSESSRSETVFTGGKHFFVAYLENLF